jgi:hypothetical protein
MRASPAGGRFRPLAGEPSSATEEQVFTVVGPAAKIAAIR